MRVDSARGTRARSVNRTHRSRILVVMTAHTTVGLAIAMVAGGAGVAHAGKYFDPGAGLGGPVTAASCARAMTPSTDPVPAWSRLGWSLATGVAWTSRNAAAVVVPQAQVALWLREWRCASGTGLLGDHLWRRWSVAASVDAAWQPRDGGLVVRPALRLARAGIDAGFLSFGSEWTPSTELYLAAGPTLAPEWRGGAVSVGGRASVLAVEARLDVDRDGDTALMLLAGVTDVHGLWRLGPARTR